MSKLRRSVSDNTGSVDSSSSRRRPCTSTDSVRVPLCVCGDPIVTKTSWTNGNPGRRFRGCSGQNGGYCDTFEWVDPPMCPRSVVVIPGLLKKINGYEKKIVELEAVRIELGLEAPGFPDPYLIRQGMREVNRVYRKIFEYSHYEDKVRRLYNRFLAFSWITSLSGVVYNPRTKELKVAPHIWAAACERKRIAMAYVDLVDPAWDELSKIFTSPNEMDTAGNDDEYVISDEGIRQDVDVISLSPSHSDNGSDEI
ncbi:hypothetical protein Salat_0256600 [Sesamum alatum]|uniref:GRF-type domain-containing protein n=1 Tax=Sesamum alatum TaxID=300844 RepID=A0AAE2CYF2_9LAMI|nr:hypothetical protein Salat_0256600 [Sesamum alatum]